MPAEPISPARSSQRTILLPHPRNLPNLSTLPAPSHYCVPQYWWVWIGLGAVLASTVINVIIFILAATFLKGAPRCAVLFCAVPC